MHFQLQHHLLSTILVITIFTTTSVFTSNEIPSPNVDENRYENSAGICDRCDCKLSDDDLTLTLDCSNRSFHKVLAEWPQHPRKLVVSFSGNSIETLAPLPGSEAEVRVTFDHCGVKFLEPGIFDSVANVTYVDFSYNQLTSSQLSADVFKGPYNNTMYKPIALKYLNLAYNQIHSLQKDVFEHTPFLQVLILEGNELKVLDQVTQLALSTIRHLQILNLANNRLVDVTDDAIKHFENLTELDISRNELDFVPPTLSYVSKTLERLNINGNPIVELTDKAFVGLNNLMELTADNLTLLESVKSNTFSPLKSLRVLRLSNCPKLQEIDREAFDEHPTLREVYLNDNILTDLHPDLLPWESLSVLQIERNQFYCTCNLYNITTRLPENIVKKDGPWCIDPWKYISYQVYNLRSDVCVDQPLSNQQRFTDMYSRFNTVKIALITLSVVLIVFTLIAMLVGWAKWRSYSRNRNYPFVSNVIYNPINTSQMGPM